MSVLEKKKCQFDEGDFVDAHEAGFDDRPFTQEEREQLGIAQYYRPYRVDQAELHSSRRLYRGAKRFVDVVCASAALLVLSPFILVFLLAIHIEDPAGSPIFKQERIGRDGKPFMFYKMRSMCVDAEEKLDALMCMNEADGKAFKMKNDPRITRVGKFIRNTSIDELLQLVNIIKGDMSIVGARDIIGTTKKYPYFTGCSVFA